MIRRKRSRRAFTLIEMVVSVLAGSILITGMASAIYMATSASDRGKGLETSVNAALAMNQMSVDLAEALVFHERGTTAVEFDVSDRDGDGNPERVRYEWSGVAGDPLQVVVNAEPASAILPDVSHLNLKYAYRSTTARPRILFVVKYSGNMTTQDLLKEQQFREWGFPSERLQATASQSAYDTAAARNDVAYISEETNSGDINTKLKQSGIGAVWEEARLNDEFGLCSGRAQYYETSLTISNNTHYITSLFPLTTMQFTKTSQPMVNSAGTVASSAVALAQNVSNSNNCLVTLNTGQNLYSSGQATGRRVMLPIGGSNFDYTQLTHNGRELVRRSIEWAAGFDRVVRVEIEVQQTTLEMGWVRRSVEPNNHPRVSGP